jgi:predicted alpha/beta-hydrolase family hydrolase
MPDRRTRALRSSLVAAGKKRWFVHEPEGSGGALDGVMLVLWHGAGGDVSEPALLAVARAFAARGAFAVRARFAYRLAGRRMPDRMPALVGEARETIASLRREVAPEPAAPRLILGGRSMGGRVSSMLAAEGFEATGLVFVAYPLHPRDRPDKLRDAHLYDVRCPMLFLQGDRDELCDLALLGPVLERIGGRATLRVFEGADHGLRKVAPATLAEAAAEWTARIVGEERRAAVRPSGPPSV